MYINYQSFTNWVFDPIYVLYAGNIYLDKSAYESVLRHGEERRSTYDIHKADILRIYKEKGIVRLTQYNELIKQSDAEKIENTIEDIVSKNKNLVYLGIIKSYEIWIKHQKNKLRILHPEEPYFDVLVNRIKVWEKHFQEIKENNPTKDDVINIGKRCIRDVFYSSYLSNITGEEILEWEQYVLWYHLLSAEKSFQNNFSVRASDVAKSFIEWKTVNKIIEFIFERKTPEIILNNIDDFFSLRSELDKLRRQIDDLKNKIYKKWISISYEDNINFKELDIIINDDILPIVDEIKTIELIKKDISKKIRRISIYSTIAIFPIVILNPVVGGSILTLLPIVGELEDDIAEWIVKRSFPSSWYLNFKSLEEKVAGKNNFILDLKIDINSLNKKPKITWWDSGYVGK